MTIVEFFDTEPSENVLAALRLQAERVVYVGFRQTMTDRRIRAVRRFYHGRKAAPQLVFLRVDDRDYPGVAAAIGDILARYPDCCFEMTGGGDLILAALGAAGAGRELCMFELDVPTQALRPVRGGAFLPAGTPARLASVSVAESISLRGGALASSAFRLDAGAPKNLREDMRAVWTAFLRQPGTWNRQCNLLAALCARSPAEGLRVEAEPRLLPDRAHLARLLDAGLLLDFEETGGKAAFTFRSQQVKRLLTRAGDLLELRVFLTASSAPAFFTDAVMGAQIDWDGQTPSDSRAAQDTANEIDGLMMHGAVPLFISCKNGEVRKEALYELDAVCARFGGRYAAKMLVATGLSGPEGSRQALRKRAADMGIRLVENAERLSEAALLSELTSAVTRSGAVPLR